ncbi:hypothetical protein [Salarchaeum sp. JOR-1]|uniref:hypothetical protein n=1 Tax=Salarchaeum sp. JOR-1 TaxID=2599399 RepID=UPI001198651A|nr:hypothetical protein [Salarchaeum sp. JOR-1]QDX39896.1 hypothetical protein FQU85_02895 [Salarchaeum sp. JOR-1]
MSERREDPEDQVDTTDVGGLGEVLPEPLKPFWMPIQRIQEFRKTWGNAYTSVLELVLGLGLAIGYVWWLVLYLG